jgi:hypothetical protein
MSFFKGILHRLLALQAHKHRETARQAQTSKSDSKSDKGSLLFLLSTNVLLRHHQQNFSTNKRKNTNIEGCSVCCQKERNILVGRTHSIQQQHHEITVVTITVMSIYLSVTLPFPQPYYHRLKLQLPKSNQPISAAITKTKTAKDKHYRTH